jgi:hypothetical protein
MVQAAQLVGAVVILIAFAGAQRGSMSPHSLVYLVLNLAGSLVLAVVAAVTGNWGFLLLEAVWAVVSAWGLYRELSEPSATHP